MSNNKQNNISPDVNGSESIMNSESIISPTQMNVSEITRSVTELTIKEIQRVAEERGVTLEVIFDKIKSKMNCQKAIMSKFGDVTYEDDNATQLKACELGLNVFKVLEKKADGGVVNNTLVLNWTDEQRERFLTLMAKKNEYDAGNKKEAIDV